MIGGDAKHITLASPAQRLFNIAYAINAIGGDKGESTEAAMVRSIMATARAGLVAKAVFSGTCAAFMRAGSSVHAFGK